jgi:hypothetical protein
MNIKGERGQVTVSLVEERNLEEHESRGGERSSERLTTDPMTRSPVRSKASKSRSKDMAAQATE